MSASSRSLYAIGDDLTAIEQLLLEIGGDVTDVEVERIIDDWLATTSAELTTKVDNYAGLIKELDARGKARGEEAARLATRSQVDANAAKRLRERLQAFFESHDIKTLETPRFRISVQQNGGVAPLILDVPADQVPEDFIKVRIEPDNLTIRKALEAGKELPFAHLGQRGMSLRIR